MMPSKIGADTTKIPQAAECMFGNGPAACRFLSFRPWPRDGLSPRPAGFGVSKRDITLMICEDRIASGAAPLS